jgi:hypothetical protein
MHTQADSSIASMLLCPACSREPSNSSGGLVCLGDRCRAVLRVARAHGINGASVLRNRVEMWLPIVGFGGDYEISTRGRVWSVRYHRFLKTPCTGRDYPQVELDGRTYRVHILMAETFLGRRQRGRIALHHNDRKSDNRIINIRWGSHRDNYADALRNGRRPLGRTIPRPDSHTGARNGVARVQSTGGTLSSRYRGTAMSGQASAEQNAAYRAGLCVDCRTLKHSVGRPRCEGCHQRYWAVLVNGQLR